MTLAKSEIKMRAIVIANVYTAMWYLVGLPGTFFLLAF
jgi:hypothetical protein